MLFNYHIYTLLLFIVSLLLRTFCMSDLTVVCVCVCFYDPNFEPHPTNFCKIKNYVGWGKEEEEEEDSGMRRRSS